MIKKHAKSRKNLIGKIETRLLTVIVDFSPTATQPLWIHETHGKGTGTPGAPGSQLLCGNRQ